MSSHQQEIYPKISLDENCIELELQTDWNYYVGLRQTYLALKLKIVRGRGYETYNTKEVKKEHKEEAKAEEEEMAEEDAPVPLVTHVNNILHSIFSNAHKSNIYNNFKGAISENKGVLHCEGTTMKDFLMKLWKRLCLKLFSQGERKRLADPIPSCCMVNWVLTFSPLLNCYIQI